MGHSAPANAEEALAQFRAKYTGGVPSPEQQKNILTSAHGILGQLQNEAKEVHDNLRENYDEDSRLRSNPRAWEAYNRLNQNTFGVLPGYEKASKAKPAAASATMPSPAPAKTVPKPVGADILEMKRYQKQGDHRFDAILKANGY
jgi:hypothetical protein